MIHVNNHFKDGEELSRWNTEEYLEIDLTLHLGTFAKSNKALLAFALEVANTTEIGIFTRTESNDVHFTAYKQNGTLEETKNNDEGRIRDAKTWQG